MGGIEPVELFPPVPANWEYSGRGASRNPRGDLPTLSRPGTDGSPVFQRVVQDPSVRLEMSQQAEHVQVIIQDSAWRQHDLLVRAEASAQYSEGQLDQARRQIFQDAVILSHVLTAEYSAFAEAYQQHMHAEISSRGLAQARGVAEDLSRRLQRTEMGAGARVTHLEQHADRLYREECECSQRRLREAEQMGAGRTRYFQEHELQARQEVHHCGGQGPRD